MSVIDDPGTLRDHMGPVSALAERKVLRHLDLHCRRFIELSPFIVLATADVRGGVDASPRGDPPGFVRIIDDATLLIPDRPGNNRADSFANLLEAPGVGLLLFVPGVDETLRVNGTGRIVTEPATLSGSEVNGRQPRTGLIIDIQEAFFHCGKALRRAALWNPAAQIERRSFPTLGRVIADQIGGVSVRSQRAHRSGVSRQTLSTSPAQARFSPLSCPVTSLTERAGSILFYAAGKNGAADMGSQQALLAGASIGVAIATPVGPMAIIVIRRTLAGGFLAGIITGAGASTTHLIYATLAVCGVDQIAAYAQSNRLVLNVVIALVLFAFAVRMIWQRRAKVASVPFLINR